MEALIAIMIITVALTSILSLATLSSIVTSIAKQTTQATLFVQDTMEALRNFRDGTDWNVNGLGTFSLNTAHYVEQIGSPAQWQLVVGSEIIDGFTRSVQFQETRRDSVTKDIVETGGDLDPDTKRIVVEVSWTERGRSHEVELVTYLTNWNQ